MSIKILATGDIHIGQRVSGLPSNADGFSAKDTWKRIVEWAISNTVDIIVLTGDIVDRDNRYFEAVGPIQSGFTRLKEKDISVFIVSGNHDFDVLPQIIKSGSFSNVHLLGAGGEWELFTFKKENEILQFAGWSFPTQYITEDPLDKFNLTDINKDIPCIGLLHGDVFTPDSKYAPIRLHKFKSFPVNTWILGHIHKPQVLNENDPFICYPGSPLAFSSKETDLHGPLLITVNNALIQKPERVLASPVRFEILEIDITGSESEDDLRNKLISQITVLDKSLEKELSDVSCLVYDITLRGTHNNIKQIESWSTGLVNDFEHETSNHTRIFVRKINTNITPGVENLAELANQNSPAGILAQIIIAINNNTKNDFLDEMLIDWKEKHIRFNNKDTFSPLNKSVESADNEETGKQCILNESKRLLGELLLQKK